MLSVSLLLAALAASTSAAPTARSTTPTVYMAGDSTMALGGGGSGTQGWGQYLHYSLTIPVVNNAIAGRSARSYNREGRFQTLIDTVKAGDFVIIELGHNDGGSLTPTDNGRSDCPGTGNETCATTYDGVAETVQTFPTYISNATSLLLAAGAHVILSSQTPDNPDETGTYTYTPSRFVTDMPIAVSSANTDLAVSAAKANTKLTSTSNSSFVDHGLYVANAYKALTVAEVDAFYPIDHTHTSPEGADLVHKAFVKGLKCGSHLLNNYVINSTSSITGSCA